MANKTIFLFLILSSLICGSLYALDWKTIHERSDHISIAAGKQIVKNNEDSLDDLYLLGLVYLDQYEEKKALSCFLKMLEIDKYSYEAKWGKAEILRRKYKFDESRHLLKNIIEKRTDFSPAYISLAYIEFTLKDYKEALKLSLKVIKQSKASVDPDNRARAYLIYGAANGMIAQTGGPLKKLIYGTQVFPNIKRAQEIKPEEAGVYFGLGTFYLLAPEIAGGNISKAETYLKKTIKQDPHFVDAYVRLAQVYKAKGDMDRFNKYLQIAFDKDPKNPLANEVKDSLEK